MVASLEAMNSEPDTIKADILTEFSWAMKISGYSEKFRLDVIQAAIVISKRRCAQAEAGLAPCLYIGLVAGRVRRDERRQAKILYLQKVSFFLTFKHFVYAHFYKKTINLFIL